MESKAISKFLLLRSGGGVGGSGVERWRLQLTSAKVEVEVEAELGKSKSYLVTNQSFCHFLN